MSDAATVRSVKRTAKYKIKNTDHSDFEYDVIEVCKYVKRLRKAIGELEEYLACEPDDSFQAELAKPVYRNLFTLLGDIQEVSSE